MTRQPLRQLTTSRGAVQLEATPQKDGSLSQQAQPITKPETSDWHPPLAEKSPPFQGLTVIAMHVKNTMRDGLLLLGTILRQLGEHEQNQKEQDGIGLGCTFVISKIGMSCKS